MLKSLNIRNYVLIDSLDIEFKEGFSVMTGETGAGKSIIIGAMNLLLGSRSGFAVSLRRNSSSSKYLCLRITACVLWSCMR